MPRTTQVCGKNEPCIMKIYHRKKKLLDSLQLTKKLHLLPQRLHMSIGDIPRVLGCGLMASGSSYITGGSNISV